MLGEVGATVYCTEHSVRGKPSSINRPETIKETAEMVTACGGIGIWAQVDHNEPDQVQSLFERIREEQGRLVLQPHFTGGWGQQSVQGAPLVPQAGNQFWKPHQVGAGRPRSAICACSTRGKAEKYPLSDVSMHGCRGKRCSTGLFMADLP